MRGLCYRRITIFNILIVIVVLLLFGGRKIPELMRGLGSGIKEFKKATKEEDDDSKKPGIPVELKDIEQAFKLIEPKGNG
ncbi:MAG: twin-arginine translocase TatA/TatE family subunit [Pseudomonadota bacterium]